MGVSVALDIQKCLDKLFSGRFILTCVCAAVFAYVSAKGIIPAEAIIVILTVVFQSYFDRQDREKKP